MVDNSKIKLASGIGIDFGTINLLVYVEGQGIIFNEPSVVAYDNETDEVVATGHQAYKMVGKAHSKIRIVRPLKNGVMSDMDAAGALLTQIFDKVKLYNDMDNLTAVICCPSEVTPIEQNALRKLCVTLGIEDTIIEEEIKSGLIGSGYNIYEPEGLMSVDIGGGTTDVGILSLGDIVISRSIRVAGNYIDNEIIKYCKSKFQIEIGSRTAEDIKLNLSTLNPDKDVTEFEFAGRDLMRGVPKFSTITSTEVTQIITPIFEDLVNLTKSTLKECPPEISGDLYQNGVLLSGGGALIDYAPEFFKERLGLPVTLSPNPLTAVVEGTKFLLRNRGDFLVNPF